MMRGFYRRSLVSPIKNSGVGVFVALTLVLLSFGCGATSPPIQPSSIPMDSEAPPVQESEGEDIPMKPRVDIRDTYQAGVSLLQAGRLQEARAVLEQVGEETPDRVEVRNALGALYRRLGLPKEAVYEYRKGLSLAKNLPRAKASSVVASHLHNNLGIALREMGQFSQAEEEYQEAIRLNSKFPDPYYNLGVLYDLYMNKGVEAVKYYKAYLSLAGKNKTVELWIKDLEQNRNKEGKR